MATATVVRPTTRDEWRERARALSILRNLDGTASYVGVCNTPGDQGHVWRIPSRSGRGGSYDVLVRRDGLIDCPCEAGMRHKPCSHAGAALRADGLRARVQRQAERDALAEAALRLQLGRIQRTIGQKREILRRVSASCDRAEAREAQRTAMRRWVSGLPWDQCW